MEGFAARRLHVADTLAACEIDERRWPSFDKALTTLYESEMLHERSS